MAKNIVTLALFSNNEQFSPKISWNWQKYLVSTILYFNFNNTEPLFLNQKLNISFKIRRHFNISCRVHDISKNVEHLSFIIADVVSSSHYLNQIGSQLDWLNYVAMATNSVTWLIFTIFQKPLNNKPSYCRYIFWMTSQHAWCWPNGLGGVLGIQGSWVQIPLGCWINTRWGWLCPSSFWGWQNECQLAGILCWSGDPSRIVPNSQGDCLGSTNALHRVWSQWTDGLSQPDYIMAVIG